MTPWTTFGDLLVKLTDLIFKGKDSILKQKRDKRDRIANYFETIASTLLRAASQFEKKERPWDAYIEVSYILGNFQDVVKDIVNNEKNVQMLFRQLTDILYADFQLLNPENIYSEERNAVRSLTRDLSMVHTSLYDIDNPINHLSKEELDKIISNEVDKIRKVAGLFKGVSIEIKAS
jgi:hypothetical protein